MVASVPVLATTPRYQLITEAEYFINEDPGEGLGTPVDLEQGFTADINLDDIPYSDGDIIFIRVMNENDVWSAPYGRTLGKNYIVEAKVFKVKYPVPDYKVEEPVDASVEVKSHNGLIVSAISDPMEGDNLQPGDTLLVQFKGNNGVWSPKYEVILADPDLELDKPLNLQAENIGNESPKVRLTWTDDSDAENRFSVERSAVSGSKKDDESPYSEWTEIATLDKDVEEYIDENLNVNTPYRWRVRALGIKDWMNSKYSNIAEILVVGVEDSDIDKPLSLRPNPAPEFIEISFAETHSGAFGVEAEVINLLGELVISHEIPTAVNSFRLDVSSLHPGAYFLRIGNETRMFVKQ